MTMLGILLFLTVVSVTEARYYRPGKTNINQLLVKGPKNVHEDVADSLPNPKTEIRRQWFWSNKCTSQKTSGTSDTFEVYTCPLDLFDGKKCGRKRWLYAPYGVTHTYIRIGDICYDWGDWDYVRRDQCDSSVMSCCTSEGSLQFTGSTSCAPRIEEFEDAWTARGKSYHLLSWNCQKYTDSMKDFLIKCCSSADDAIKNK